MLAGIHIGQRQAPRKPNKKRKWNGDQPQWNKVDDRSCARIPAASKDPNKDGKIDGPKRQRKAHHKNGIRCKPLCCGRRIGVKIRHVNAKRAHKCSNEHPGKRRKPEEAFPINMRMFLLACSKRIAEHHSRSRPHALEQNEGKLIHCAHDHHCSKCIRPHLAVDGVLRNHAERPDGIAQ